MGSQLTTLTSSDIHRFQRDGYVVVRQAFSPADALAMERRWWSELEGVGGVFDDLLGKGAWEVPTRLWHWDNVCDLHIDRPRALFVVSFIGSVAPGSGGTLILSGSPRLLVQQECRIPASQRGGSGTSVWERFHRSHPWLMALTGLAPSPADRTAAFMEGETIVEDVPLRVVELTGEPGDMVFCHPVIVHCRAQNRGARPRFMRIKQQLLTNEGRKLRSQEHT
jgi:hypothetical protein